MKTKIKKILAVVLVVTVAMSMFTICGYAESPGMSLGPALGTIIFSPFILIDTIIYVVTGIHVFYWWW